MDEILKRFGPGCEAATPVGGVCNYTKCDKLIEPGDSGWTMNYVRADGSTAIYAVHLRCYQQLLGVPFV